MNSPRAPRRTTDLPAQQAARSSISLASFAQRHARAVRIAYLLCIGLATLLNLHAEPSLANVVERLRHAVEPTLRANDLIDAARNIALFFGWGAIYTLTARIPLTRRDVGVATVVGMLASFSVESAQLFSPVRQASILDLFTNTIGSLLGALSFRLLERRAISDMRRGTMIGVPGWMPAGAVLVLAFGLTFAPSTRAGRVLSWAGSPFTRGQVVESHQPLTVPLVALVTDVVAWIVVGLVVAVAISDRTGEIRRRQLVAWLVLAPGLLALAHLGRDLVGFQREQITAAVQGTSLALGLLAGLVSVPAWRRRCTARSDRALHVGLLVMLVGAVISWTPHWSHVDSARPRFSWSQLIPMMSLLERQDLTSVFLVLQRAGIGAALGACLAARRRVGVPHPRLRAAIGFAALLEVGQLLVPSRYPDVTDVMITSAAAILVAILVERAARGAALAEPGSVADLNGNHTTGSF